MVKKILIGLGVGLGALLLLALIGGLILHEAKPEGQEGPAAEALAERMLEAIDYPAWDSTTYVGWTFAGRHHFIWDKQRDLCQVRWGDRRVLLRLNEVNGLAWEDGQESTGARRDELVQSAWAYFCNDSFWLNAPAKAFDPGTRRSLVPLEDGGQGLMVQYSSGGVTPGDSYLWILDENHRPVAWKMWVSVLPIGGVYSSWEDWKTLPTGARLATRHGLGPVHLELSEVRGGMTLAEVGLQEDPFIPLFAK